MAKVFRIANKGQTITMDFLNGTFKLVDRPELWPFLIGGDGRSIMTDSFQVIGRGNYVTVLGPEKADMELYFERLRAWHENPILDESWWLEWNLNGESPKRSLLYPGTNINHVSGAGLTPMGDRMAQMKLGIPISRHPAWENISPTESSKAAVKAVGDVASGLLQVTNEGTLPSRIYTTVITNESESGVYETIWLGFRPYYKGYSLFETGLDLADGTAGTDTTSSADTSAVVGTAMVCTFSSDESLVQRVLLRMSDVVLSGTEGWKGRYLVLLRYRCNSTSPNEFGIQLRHGYDAALFTENEEVFVETADTNYHIAEMGEVTWPPGESRNIVGSDILLAAFKIYAERLSGANNLHLDRLILIPSEHAIKIEDAAVSFGGVDDVIVYTFENDEIAAYDRESGTILNSVSPDATRWYIPVGATNGAILGAAAVRAGNISNKADTMDISIAYVPRWKSYRL